MRSCQYLNENEEAEFKGGLVARGEEGKWNLVVFYNLIAIKKLEFFSLFCLFLLLQCFETHTHTILNNKKLPK